MTTSGSAALVRRVWALSRVSRAALVHGYAVAARPGGSLVFAGQTHTNQTGNDAFLGAMEADGAIGWGLHLTVDDNEWFEDIAALADGSVIAVGSRNQTLDMNARAWILKASASGEVEWDHELDPADTTEGALHEVVALADGRVAAFGCCLDGGDFLLRAYEADGAEAWTAPLPKLADASIFSSAMAVDACGDIFTAWRTEDDALWIAKHSAAGAEIWSKTLTDPDLHGVQPMALVTTPQGKLVLGGGRKDNMGDAVYAVLDADAGLLWSETISGPGGDTIRNLAVDSRGVVLAVGQVYEDDPMGWVRMFAP